MRDISHQTGINQLIFSISGQIFHRSFIAAFKEKISIVSCSMTMDRLLLILLIFSTSVTLETGNRPAELLLNIASQDLEIIMSDLILLKEVQGNSFSQNCHTIWNSGILNNHILILPMLRLKEMWWNLTD